MQISFDFVFWHISIVKVMHAFLVKAMCQQRQNFARGPDKTQVESNYIHVSVLRR